MKNPRFENEGELRILLEMVILQDNYEIFDILLEIFRGDEFLNFLIFSNDVLSSEDDNLI